MTRRAEAMQNNHHMLGMEQFRRSASRNSSFSHNLPVATPQPQDTFMDASHFGNFGFSFHGVPTQDSIVALPGQFQADSFVSPSATAQDAAVAATPSFAPDRPFHPRSVADSDDGDKDAGSPPVNSLEDSFADEFDLAGQGRASVSDLRGKIKDDKTDAPPAWTELKTKAGKERKRLPLACIACRRKKIRCSGEKPACKHCLRSRIPCVYKVTARKAAPRTDYMSMLDKRLKRMEERIIKVIPKAEQDSTSSITRAVVKPTIPGSASAGKLSNKKRRADEAFGPDLEIWAKGTSKADATEEQRLKMLQTQEAEDDALFRDGGNVLPPKDVQEHLAEVYFENVYGQAYHLLHKPSYMRKLKNNTLPPVLVLSVCAVAARFSANPKMNSTTRQFLRGEEWASHARDICTKRYEWPNITILTCLLILGLHEFGTCQGGRSWALGGQAIRMAFALQLHKDLEYDPNSRGGQTKLSFIDREIRRRTMWACFLMDRFNSSSMDRPLFVHEETLDIPLPVNERYFQLDMPVPTEKLGQGDDSSPADFSETMGVAAYMIRSVALWGRMISYFNEGCVSKEEEPIWSPGSQLLRLTKAADDFALTLPAALGWSADNLKVHQTSNTANQYLLLHLSIQQNILFVNRNAAAAANGSDNEKGRASFVAESLVKVTAAANRTSEILKDAEAAQCFVSAPFAGYCAYSSATVHVNGISSRNPNSKAVAEVNSGINVKFLRKMMKHWGVFHWMVEHIRLQYRVALDAARSGTPARDLSESSPILHYGDWFDRYPHGISDSDFMDPAMSKKRERGADGVLEQKPELQSVEEYFETLSPPQSTGSRDGPRASVMKKTAPTSASGPKPGQPQLEPLVTTNIGRDPASQLTSGKSRQHYRLSGSVPTQGGGSVAFNPMVAQHAQHSSYHTLSPISPVVSQFPNQGHAQHSFYSPSMLSMNASQSSNGMMQPVNRHMSFDGYTMGSNNGMGGHGMMGPVADWNRMSMSSPSTHGPNHNDHQHSKHGLDERHMQEQGGFSVSGAADIGRHDNNSAWFMPFGLESTDMSQDLGFGLNSVDAFGGMLGGSGSGMTTPNPLTSLQ